MKLEKSQENLEIIIYHILSLAMSLFLVFFIMRHPDKFSSTTLDACVDSQSFVNSWTMSSYYVDRQASCQKTDQVKEDI